VEIETEQKRRGAGGVWLRHVIWLAAGATIALPLGACQPSPAGSNRKTPGPTHTPTTAASHTDAPQPSDPPPREVVREKIVYVDRPVVTERRDEVLATVGNREIKYSQIREPLMKGHGLSVLLYVVQLELARAEAERRGVKLGEKDFKAETDATLVQMFPEAKPEDHERLLGQLLQQQKLTRADFELVMATNAHLRAIASTQIPREIKDETLREAFNIRYGETVRVRHIACSNLQEVAEAQKRLAAGAGFEAVARELSRNPRTAPLGGELPPFSRASQDVAPSFKDAAFALKEGEVSDPVQAESMFHLIKLERRIAPKAIRFEDVRESLKADLTRLTLDAAVKEFRQTLADQARATLDIKDPILAEQWKARVLDSDRATPATPPAR
jgi:foldase protein PrsA